MKVIQFPDAKKAHKHSIRHYEEIQRSIKCGCFHCCRIFEAEEVRQWVEETDGGVTGLCPFCGIDSIIGDASGYPIVKGFLRKMERAFF